MATVIGREELLAEAKTLWALRKQLEEAASRVEKMMQIDDMLARTLGDDGEYISDRILNAKTTLGNLAMRMDRTVAFNDYTD